MSRGRPAAIRSAPLSDYGLPLSEGQWAEVLRVLRIYYRDPASSSFAGEPEPLVIHHSPGAKPEQVEALAAAIRPATGPVASNALNDLFARYQARVKTESKVVGVEAERADLRAIAKDCRQLAGLLPVEPINDWPEKLCGRLFARLVAFPPMADAALRADGVDVWPLLERLREAVPRPYLWAGTPTLSADLLALADACERPMEQATRTKRPRTARDAFVRGIIKLVDETPPTKLRGRDAREGLIGDICRALGIPEPDDPYANPRRRK